MMVPTPTTAWPHLLLHHGPLGYLHSSDYWKMDAQPLHILSVFCQQSYFSWWRHRVETECRKKYFIFNLQVHNSLKSSLQPEKKKLS